MVETGALKPQTQLGWPGLRRPLRGPGRRLGRRLAWTPHWGAVPGRFWGRVQDGLLSDGI